MRGDDDWIAPAFAHLARPQVADVPPEEIPPEDVTPEDVATARRPRTSQERAHLHHRVLEVVHDIPQGRVMTYGDIGALVGLGPREVGRVLARTEEEVPWWRVCNAAGRWPEHLNGAARHEHEQEGTPLRPLGVDLRAARWRP